METGALDREVAWVTREGEFEALDLPRGSWELPRLSPDGNRLLIAGVEGGTRRRPGNLPQGVFDIRTGVRTPLANGGEHAWSSTGDFVFFSPEVGRAREGIGRQPADASATPELFADSLPISPWVTSASPDGRTLLFYSENIWEMDVESGGVRVLIDDPGVERNAQFSPDGAYVAYSSTGSGREEVYVRPYPALDQRWTISSDGGELPMWSRDGSELFFISGDRMMVTPAIVDGAFRQERPQELFRGGFVRQPNGDQSFDLAPDGRLIVIRGSAATTITVTTGWLEAALSQVRTRGN
jgi:hypothetical protein